MPSMIHRQYPPAIPGELQYIDTLDDPNFNEDDYGVFGEQSGHCYYWGGIKDCNDWLKGEHKDA